MIRLIKGMDSKWNFIGIRDSMNNVNNNVNSLITK